MASYSVPDPEIQEVETNSKTWLQLYVDAMTEKDPYKRLALVNELRKLPRHDDSEDLAQERALRSARAAKRSKPVRRQSN